MHVFMYRQVILSGPPAWATDLFKSNKTAFYEAYQAYAAKVAATTNAISPHPTMFQLWNEVCRSGLGVTNNVHIHQLTHLYCTPR